MFNVLALLLLSHSHASVNLEDSWKASFKQSELIADQIEQVNQAEEKHKQAVAAVLPAITAVSSYQIQDTSNVTTTSGFFQGAQPLIKLNLAQPLFRGFREFAGLRQTNKTVSAIEQAKAQAGLQLMLDVSTNYFQVLSYEKDLKNYQNELALYEARAKEIEKRIEIGRSKEAELLLLQSQEATTRASVQQTDGLRQSSRQVYAFLTGLAPDTEIADWKTSLKAASLADYLKKVETRPDLQSNKLKFDAADEGVSIAKGSHLPNLDLNFNYYFLRSGLLSSVAWDSTLSFSWPLFAGGAISSGVRVAVSQRQQAELAYERSLRQAKQDIGALYATYQADLKQFEELKSAADFAKQYYQAQAKDYKLGLVTNIDLQLALSSYQQSVRARDRAEYNVALDLLKLKIQSGEIQNGTL